MSEREDDFRIGPSPSGRLLCGGCAPDDRCRLGIETAHAGEGATTFDVVCPRHWHGGPEVAHGGWTAAVFDDVLNVVALRGEARLVTKSLHISYHVPIPVERPLEVTARIDSHAGRRWEVSARMTLAGDTVALASASAELRTRRPDHFAKHHAWLAHH
ncbi:PaaI family thioesterase [Amycolatopsis benzoatilytica]|uniref:PaaI family thioesterase n=1 Tax=Amycolatopsis benzoatilytica TaxID=346045 RepID=UPI000361323B|nr:PaaI family thioesterase [Amycolatopsis benzoatilytica]